MILTNIIIPDIMVCMVIGDRDSFQIHLFRKKVELIFLKKSKIKGIEGSIIVNYNLPIKFNWL
jgi:hypothetical protein